MKHRRLLVLAIAIVVALGMCPMAFAAGHDLAPTTVPSDSKVETNATATPQYFEGCTVVAKTRIRVGSKKMNPVVSVKSPSGKVLREGKGYRIEYFRADMYNDLTKRLKKAPTEPGRYLAMLYPIDTKAYRGMYAVYYQVTPKGFVEHPFTEAQKAEITESIYTGDTYHTLYDSQTPWSHYAKPGTTLYKAYKALGLQDYMTDFDESSVRYFWQDPNDGSYFITSYDGSARQAYTQVGLTYNMPLCVAVTEASYSLNKLADTVSDKAGYDVRAKFTWVSTKSYNALKSAISDAVKVATKKGASKTKVKAAQKQLNKAMKYFKPKPGKKGKKLNLKKAKVENMPELTYTGSPLSVNPLVKYGKEKLTPGKHYTLSYVAGKKIVKATKVKNAGKYKMIITGKGTCEGKKAKAFKIARLPIDSWRIYSYYIPSQRLKKAGTPVTPKVKLHMYNGQKGVILKQGRDYKLTYKNNTKVGTARAIVKGMGNFTGTRVINFEIE